MTTVVISLVAENWKTWHGARYSNENVMSALAQTNFLSLKGVLQAMENGGRLALGVAAACACTGFVIGVVTLTGLGLKLANAILTISADSFALTLLLTMLASIVLGMGLPTTAKYIVLATIAAPAIMHFGVPAMAAHLFILYFGILADDTPPVGLAAYAGAAIAKANPISVGVQGFLYDIRTAIIPVFFLFNSDILLIGIESLPVSLMIFAMTGLGMVAVSSAIQGWLIDKVNILERLILVAATVVLMFPALISGYVLPYEQRWWGYLVGIALFGIAFLSQKVRYGAKKKNQAAVAESDEELAVS